ncbi:MAG: ATP phosphoribosyltransferase [Saprospiraceae bacterium]|nr:ATP phosphoribosyltransferase [Saprospiraceae bacterium]
MKRLRIAVQKSGRLSEISLELLKECGIDVKNGRAQLVASASNFPLDILYLRDDDIPQYVEDGVADLGILGENVVVESRANIDIIKRLDFGRCRLSLAVPKAVDYQGLEYFQDRKVATSYPNILNDYLSANGITSEVHVISGSVEIAPNIGLADAICDIVSTGSTLLSNGLKEVESIFRSEAVLVSRKGLDTEGANILQKLLFRLDSVRAAKSNKYVVLNAPNDSIEAITQVLPGMKSPTVVPLATEGWSAIHSVLNEEKFWDIIDDLKAAGAQGILVVPIEKMII